MHFTRSGPEMRKREEEKEEEEDKRNRRRRKCWESMGCETVRRRGKRENRKFPIRVSFIDLLSNYNDS